MTFKMVPGMHDISWANRNRVARGMIQIAAAKAHGILDNSQSVVINKPCLNP